MTYLQVRVVRVEHKLNESNQSVEQIIVAKPLCAQYAGRYLEYQLSVEEFLEARHLYTNELNVQLKTL